MESVQAFVDGLLKSHFSRGIVVGGGVAVMLLKNAPSPLNSLDTDKANVEKLEEIATISPLKQPWIA